MFSNEFCEKCNLPFKVFEKQLEMPGTIERETIYCPTCDTTISEKAINGLFICIKMTEEEVQDYFNKKRDQ